MKYEIRKSENDVLCGTDADFDYALACARTMEETYGCEYYVAITRD